MNLILVKTRSVIDYQMSIQSAWLRMNFRLKSKNVATTEVRVYGLFPIKDMQTLPPSLRNSQIYMKDANCAETNEKSIFRFLFFELWWKFIQNWGDSGSKMTITWIIKIGKLTNASWIYRDIWNKIKCSDSLIVYSHPHREIFSKSY